MSVKVLSHLKEVVDEIAKVKMMVSTLSKATIVGCGQSDMIVSAAATYALVFFIGVERIPPWGLRPKSNVYRSILFDCDGCGYLKAIDKDELLPFSGAKFAMVADSIIDKYENRKTNIINRCMVDIKVMEAWRLICVKPHLVETMPWEISIITNYKRLKAIFHRPPILQVIE